MLAVTCRVCVDPFCEREVESVNKCPEESPYCGSRVINNADGTHGLTKRYMNANSSCIVRGANSYSLIRYTKFTRPALCGVSFYISLRRARLVLCGVNSYLCFIRYTKLIHLALSSANFYISVMRYTKFICPVLSGSNFYISRMRYTKFI